MKIPYNILIQIKMSVRPYFKGFTLIFFFYNCRKQDYNVKKMIIQSLSLSAKPSVSLHPHLIFLLKNEKLIKVR